MDTPTPPPADDAVVDTPPRQIEVIRMLKYRFPDVATYYRERDKWTNKIPVAGGFAMEVGYTMKAVTITEDLV